MVDTTTKAYWAAFWKIVNKAIHTYKNDSDNYRLGKALEIIHNGGIELLLDGTAIVSSQSNAGTSYTVNGKCSCPDYLNAPGNRCKHRYAKTILKRILTELALSRSYMRYWAIHTRQDGTEILGIAVPVDNSKHYWFVPEGTTKGFLVSSSHTVLNGSVDLYQEVWGNKNLASIVCNRL